MSSDQRQLPIVLSALSRIFWMMIGPMILAALALSIVRTGEGWFTPVDIAFLLVLTGLIAARGLEFLGDNPQTSDGRAATPSTLWRYALGVVVIGLAVWVGANFLGNIWLAQ